jgi:hypothetical protein
MTGSTSKVNTLNETSLRCMGCYGWTDRPHGVGIFVPLSGTLPFDVPLTGIPYPICKKCKQAILRGGKHADRVTQNAESYIVGLAKELAEVGE